MSTARRTVRAEALTPDRWAPFGWLPVEDTDPHDGDQRMSFDWDDVHVNIIGHARAEVPENERGLLCQMLFRHDTHTQAIMALNVPAVIAVAAAEAAFQGGDDQAPGAVRAFLIEPLQPFVLHKGTWHWGPFPTTAAAVRLFNVQGLRYREDNTCVDLAELGLDVTIELP